MASTGDGIHGRAAAASTGAGVAGGSAVRWQAVRVSGDSVSGIPFLRPITCDSCRTALPRATVDSIRLGSPVAGFWKTVGLITGTFVLAGLIYCWQGCFPT